MFNQKKMKMKFKKLQQNKYLDAGNKYKQDFLFHLVVFKYLQQKK